MVHAYLWNTASLHSPDLLPRASMSVSTALMTGGSAAVSLISWTGSDARSPLPASVFGVVRATHAGCRDLDRLGAADALALAGAEGGELCRRVVLAALGVDFDTLAFKLRHRKRQHLDVVRLEVPPLIGATIRRCW